jgi:putative ribosome biogenesis GTPase RsgA
LINTLLGETVQLTGAIREDDGKGRHVTTGCPDVLCKTQFPGGNWVRVAYPTFGN